MSVPLTLSKLSSPTKFQLSRSWKKYLANLSEKNRRRPLRKTRKTLSEKKRDALLTKLIDEIAKSLKFRVEQLDILEGNYVPQGWNDDDWEQRLVRRGLIEVLHGRRPLTVQPFAAQNQNSPYPPAPEIQPGRTGLWRAALVLSFEGFQPRGRCIESRLPIRNHLIA